MDICLNDKCEYVDRYWLIYYLICSKDKNKAKLAVKCQSQKTLNRLQEGISQINAIIQNISFGKYKKTQTNFIDT